MTRRHHRMLQRLCLVLLVVMLVPMAVSTAQHALDANLRLNSRGYNRKVNTPTRINRSRYAAGSSKPLYTLDRTGGMAYNPNNAFSPRSRYRSTGYRGDRSSHAYSRRFRYQGGASRY